MAREIGERVRGELPGGILAVITGLAMLGLPPNTALSAAVAANGRPSKRLARGVQVTAESTPG